MAHPHLAQPEQFSQPALQGSNRLPVDIYLGGFCGGFGQVRMGLYSLTLQTAKRFSLVTHLLLSTTGVDFTHRWTAGEARMTGGQWCSPFTTHLQITSPEAIGI